jgi:hypothetical protein
VLGGVSCWDAHVTGILVQMSVVWYFVAVGALWGITNPLLNAGSKGMSSSTSESRNVTGARRLWREILFLIANWRVSAVSLVCFCARPGISPVGCTALSFLHVTFVLPSSCSSCPRLPSISVALRFTSQCWPALSCHWLCRLATRSPLCSLHSLHGHSRSKRCHRVSGAQRNGRGGRSSHVLTRTLLYCLL